MEENEITKELIKAGIDVGKSFVEAVFLPPAKELGKLLSDQVSYFRLVNKLKMLQKVQVLLQNNPDLGKLIIDPRVALQILDNVSEVSNDTLQNMWAGLFAASCGDYQEDENIFFIALLKSLTSSQVKLLSYLCEHSKKTCLVNNLDKAEDDGVVYAEPVAINYQTLCSIMETDSRLKLDTELDALQNAGLITPARLARQDIPLSTAVKSQTEIRPTLKTLRLYVKCQGSSLTPFHYFINDLNNYYYEIIKNFISVEPSNTLKYIHEVCLIGATYKDDITWGNELTLNNEDWAKLSIDELSSRLRSYVVYWYIASIGKTFQIYLRNPPNIADKTYIGNFSYKEGVTRGN